MNHHMCLKVRLKILLAMPRPVPTEQPLPTSPADGWQASRKVAGALLEVYKICTLTLCIGTIRDIHVRIYIYIISKYSECVDVM